MSVQEQLEELYQRKEAIASSSAMKSVRNQVGGKGLQKVQRLYEDAAREHRNALSKRRVLEHRLGWIPGGRRLAGRLHGEPVRQAEQKAAQAKARLEGLMRKVDAEATARIQRRLAEVDNEIQSLLLASAAAVREMMAPAPVLAPPEVVAEPGEAASVAVAEERSASTVEAAAPSADVVPQGEASPRTADDVFPGEPVGAGPFAATVRADERLPFKGAIESAAPVEPTEIFLPRKATSGEEIVPVRIEQLPDRGASLSLSGLLGGFSWRKICGAELAEVHECDICGEKDGLALHESWSYSDPVDGQQFAVARLNGFRVLCDACHGMFHLNITRGNPKLQFSLDRMRSINSWTVAELGGYIEWSTKLASYRNRADWALDLSILTPHAPLVVSDTWEPAMVNECLERQDPATGFFATTRVFGVSWVLGNDWTEHKAEPAP